MPTQLVSGRGKDSASNARRHPRCAYLQADRIQVAINLNGYTKGARNEIFALCPAPVQTSYMGFPATTGASFLPYLITDKVRLTCVQLGSPPLSLRTGHT